VCVLLSFSIQAFAATLTFKPIGHKDITSVTVDITKAGDAKPNDKNRKHVKVTPTPKPKPPYKPFDANVTVKDAVLTVGDDKSETRVWTLAADDGLKSIKIFCPKEETTKKDKEEKKGEDKKEDKKKEDKTKESKPWIEVPGIEGQLEITPAEQKSLIQKLEHELGQAKKP